MTQRTVLNIGLAGVIELVGAEALFAFGHNLWGAGFAAAGCGSLVFFAVRREP